MSARVQTKITYTFVFSSGEQSSSSMTVKGLPAVKRATADIKEWLVNHKATLLTLTTETL